MSDSRLWTRPSGCNRPLTSLGLVRRIMTIHDSAKHMVV